MAKPTPGNFPPPGGFGQHFAAMPGSFLCEAGPARDLVFKQLADNPMTTRVASRLPLVQQRIAHLRAARARHAVRKLS